MEKQYAFHVNKATHVVNKQDRYKTSTKENKREEEQ